MIEAFNSWPLSSELVCYWSGDTTGRILFIAPHLLPNDLMPEMRRVTGTNIVLIGQVERYLQGLFSEWSYTQFAKLLPAGVTISPATQKRLREAIKQATEGARQEQVESSRVMSPV
jgi:hypothetical protein